MAKMFGRELARMEVESNGIDDSPRDETTNFRRAFGSNKTSLYDYAEIFCCYDQPRNKLVYFLQFWLAKYG